MLYFKHVDADLILVVTWLCLKTRCIFFFNKNNKMLIKIQNVKLYKNIVDLNYFKLHGNIFVVLQSFLLLL